MCDLIVCHLIVNVKVKAELGLKPQSNFVRTTKIISRFKKTLGLRSPTGAEKPRPNGRLIRAYVLFWLMLFCCWLVFRKKTTIKLSSSIGHSCSPAYTYIYIYMT